MSKFILALFFSINIPCTAESNPKLAAIRTKVGPIYTPPVRYKDQIYFLSGSGALYRSDLDLRLAKEIFKTKLMSVAEPQLDGSTLYFGDGLHEDQNSHLYALDLEKQKLKFSVPVRGHIEKRVAVMNQTLIVGLGPGGIAAFDQNTGKKLWSVDRVEGKRLHVDSTPLLLGETVLVGSIYQFKAVLALNAKTGALLWSRELSQSPKADLVMAGEYVVALASDGDLSTTERKIPSTLHVLKASTGEELFHRELRGSNYFPPLVFGDKIFFGLTTGDVLLVEIPSGKIAPIDLQPEPFLSSPFLWKGQNCLVSVMGRLFCYRGSTPGDKAELGEVVLGKTSQELEGRVYLPTRAGLSVLRR